MEYVYALSECLVVVPIALLAFSPLMHEQIVTRKAVTGILLGLTALMAVEAFACVSLSVSTNHLVAPTLAVLAYPYYKISRLSVTRAAFVYLVAASSGALACTLAVTVDAVVVGNTISDTFLAWPGALTQWGTHILLLFILFEKHGFVIPQVLQSSVLNTLSWRIFWLVPALSCAFLWYLTPSVADTELGTFNPDFVILTACAVYALDYIVYWLASLAADRAIEMIALSQRNHFLALQAIQYKHLEQGITDTRRFRHNIRQHYHTMHSLLDQGNLEGARAYLNEMAATYKQHTTQLAFCANPALNALISYYTEEAREIDAVVEVDVKLPQTTHVSDNDMSVLLGNLLENAVDALKEQRKGERILRVTIAGATDKPLFVAVDNSFEHDIQRSGELFLSTKHPGSGLGIESVRAIAEQYDGVSKFEYSDGLFRASAMLNPPPQRLTRAPSEDPDV